MKIAPLLPTVLYLLLCTKILQAQQRSSWEIIQTEIFNQNCIGCHLEGSSFARQSGLVLTGDVAYENLIDVPPRNSQAAADGLMLVSSEGRLTAPHRSFLWEKINQANQAHFYNDHPNYGSLMPLGQQSLTNGQIAFIQQWIENGASRDEVIADSTLLQDTTRYEPPEFQALAPPTQGHQFHLGPFNVWSADKWDREFLYYEPYPTTEDLFIKRYEISMRPGSHHFIMYHYPSGKATPEPQTYRDIRSSSGSYNLVPALQLNDLFPFFFFIGTQVPYTSYHFPEGVALRVPSGSGFDLNLHSVNRTGETQIGEVYVNLHTVDRSEVTHAAQYDNFGNYDITLPPNQTTTLAYTGTFTETRHIIQMWSHSHEHTTEFKIEGVGGDYDKELIYWTNDWEHPPFLQFDPPLTMQAGEGFRLTTTYQNNTNGTITFGPLSTDEMQFVFYLYYTGNVSSVQSEQKIPSEYALHQNYPNPFNPETTIRYTLPERSDVSLKIYNLLGREITTLVYAQQNAGTKRISWDGRDRFGSEVSSGIYIYRLAAGKFVFARKMMVLR